MKTSYLTYLTVVAGSLALTAINAVPTSASIDDTVNPVMDQTANPADGLKLSTVDLIGDAARSNPAEFARVARTSSTQRRTRTRVKTTKARRTNRKPVQVIRKATSRDIKRNWKYATWAIYQQQMNLTGTQGTAEIPPTDCPPAPTQECLDSWKDANDDIANWPD